jgi:hypothetical protein
VPDFSKCTVIWSGHALRRAEERGISSAEAERIIRESVEQTETRFGRWIIWGCVTERRTKVVVKPLRDRCIVVSIIRTGTSCI